MKFGDTEDTGVLFLGSTYSNVLKQCAIGCGAGNNEKWLQIEPMIEYHLHDPEGAGDECKGNFMKIKKGKQFKPFYQNNRW